MKFKVGDRVRVKDKFEGIDLKGKIGTIIGGRPVTRPFDWCVEFDEPFVGGHNGYGGKKNCCRFGNSNELELIKKTSAWKIEIVPDGEKTTATLYKRGKAVKSATVKRYKGDEYSIADAADYVVQKLFEKKKEKKFEVGVRVVATRENCGNKRVVGEKGTIIKKSGNIFGVEFDNNVEGHNCFDGDGVGGKNGHCWWFIKDELKLI